MEDEDKELLELAAEAAGIDPKWDGLFWQWNPLRDDGDALRLAVVLGFINPGQWPVPAWEADNMLQKTGTVDWFAATRRAIVVEAARRGHLSRMNNG